jgi:hypothetical protein
MAWLAASVRHRFAGNSVATGTFCDMAEDISTTLTFENLTTYPARVFVPAKSALCPIHVPVLMAFVVALLEAIGAW